MAKYQVMTWRDIPSQVKATDGDETARVSLPSFFQQEIDRVAMAEGVIDSDAYLEAWSWSAPEERSGSAQAVAEAVADEVGRAWRAANGREGAD
jgi:hypothetical protein